MSTNFAKEFKLYESLFSLKEAKTGIPYKGYTICYGFYDTDRYYIKNSYDEFIGVKSGYTNEAEARAAIDELAGDSNEDD